MNYSNSKNLLHSGQKLTRLPLMQFLYYTFCVLHIHQVYTLRTTAETTIAYIN